MGKKIKKFGHLYFMLLFPVMVVYYELLFQLFTVRSIRGSFFYTILFSMAYGGIGYLLSSISKNRKTNRIVTACLIAGTAIPYIVEFMIYRVFQNFYDIVMITGNATNVAGTYTSELFDTIIKSIPAVIAFLIPFVLYLIFGNKYLPAYKSNSVLRIISASSSVLCYVLAVLLISISTIYGPVYKSEYSFRSSVENFGLLSGLRLDAKYLMFGRDDSFVATDIPDINNEDEPPAPIEYGYNKLDAVSQAINKNASGKIGELNSYVSSLPASRKNQYTGLFKGKNLIMISAEAFTAEVIDPVRTPTLYRLANKGIQFTDYYQPSSAGTTGGEYQNIFGMLPMAGGNSFKNTTNKLNYYTMGSQLDRLGYFGKAYHNNSYTYYSRNKTHNNLGYSEGFMGMGNGMEKYVSNAWPQSDLEMFSGTLTEYIDHQPFNIYYMSVSGHNAYTKSGNSMTNKNWDSVKDLPYSDTVKGYLAANMELENALTHMVKELEAKGIANDTVIVISTDHFPYGLDDAGSFGNMPYLSELYGYNVTDYFKRDHNRLIIWSGCLESMEPIVVDSPTFSLDILPTLSNLFGTEFDSRLMPGRDVLSDADALVFNTNYDWKTDLGTYYASTGKFVPADSSVEVPDDYISAMKNVVRNKINYCTAAPQNDYLRYIFG